MESDEPFLGVEEGGMHSAEALLLARYFMFSQVYLHPVRRIYDIHLRDFMKEWLKDGMLGVDKESHQKFTDSEILAGMRESARNSDFPGHEHARCILNREHFKLLYQRQPADMEITPDPGEILYNALKEKFGQKYFRRDNHTPKGSTFDFPVSRRDGSIVSSLLLSEVLNNIPVVSVDYIFASREVDKEANEWLEDNKEKILNREV